MLQRDAENGMQEITNGYISLIDKYLEAKEKEIMSV